MPERVTIDPSVCVGCLLCTQVCLLDALARGVDGKPRVDAQAQCIRCGHCVAVCPEQAITRNEIGPVPEAPNEIASYEQLVGLLSMRRSRREFKPDPVPREVIEKLLAAAAQAPNALNRQLVHYTVITDATTRKQLVERTMLYITRMSKLYRNRFARFVAGVCSAKVRGLGDLGAEVAKITESYADGRDVILYDAPCTILVHTPVADFCGPENSVYCAANILLAAQTLGLGACVIGFVTGPARSDRHIGRIVGIPDDHIIHTTIALGYPRFDYARPAPKPSPNVKFI